MVKHTKLQKKVAQQLIDNRITIDKVLDENVKAALNAINESFIILLEEE